MTLPLIQHQLQINSQPLDDPDRPYIIAEASGNHNQDPWQARYLIQAAARAGVSAIKFQTFTPEEICADVPILFGHDAAHDAWLRNLGVTRMPELFAKGGLPRSWHRDLKQEATDLGIDFLSTPFSVDAAKFLVEEIGVQALKIASGDLTFDPLHEYAASTGLPVIMSTGGATIEEVAQALHWYPLHPNVVLLHCVSVYPCDPSLLNLSCIQTLRDRFGVPSGFSDHTLSTSLVPAMAVAYEATVFEKHLKLASDTSSVDVGHSLDEDGFRCYVETIRACAQIRGTGIKAPVPGELHDRAWARRSPRDWKRPTDAAREGRWA